MANKKPEAAKIQPKRSVLTLGLTPMAQYILKKTGKNPAMTVVKKTLFAQSYKAHEKIFLSMPYIYSSFT